MHSDLSRQPGLGTEIRPRPAPLSDPATLTERTTLIEQQVRLRLLNGVNPVLLSLPNAVQM